MSRLLIRNGEIVTAERVFRGDVLAAGGKIAAVGTGLEPPGPAARVIDAAGAYVLPGGVDPHVHMELPSPAGASGDDFASGSAAALAGGTTTIIDFVTPGRGESLRHALGERKRAAQMSSCDWALHMSVTAWTDQTPAEMARCVLEEGIPSFMIYMHYT